MYTDHKPLFDVTGVRTIKTYGKQDMIVIL
jgi:hypothetical protein